MFKILANVVQTKNEEVSELFKHFLDETNLVTFLMANGPILHLNEG